MDNKTCLARALDLKLPDRPPILSGWLAAPEHIQPLTGCSEETYRSDSLHRAAERLAGYVGVPYEKMQYGPEQSQSLPLWPPANATGRRQPRPHCHHELVVTSLLEGDHEVDVHTLMLDPLTAAVCSLEEIRRLFDEMYQAEREFIREF